MKQITTVSIYTLLQLLLLVAMISIKTCLCHHTNIDKQYLACEPKSCGRNGINISFPFWIQGHQQDAFCGYPGFDLVCNAQNQPVLNISGHSYIVQNIYYNNQSLRVTDEAVFSNEIYNSCFHPNQNQLYYSFGDNFLLASSYTKMFFFSECSGSIFVSLRPYYGVYGCPVDFPLLAILGENNPNFVNVSENCKASVKVPVETYGGDDPDGKYFWNYYAMVLKRGLVLDWAVARQASEDCSRCERSGGRCGFDEEKYQFRCFCTDGPQLYECRISPTETILKEGECESDSNRKFICASQSSWCRNIKTKILILLLFWCFSIILFFGFAEAPINNLTGISPLTRKVALGTSVAGFVVLVLIGLGW